MRISDWSSDVCSSDLFARAQASAPQELQTLPQLWARFEKTWDWRNAQLREGRIELVFDDIETDDVPPDGLLEIEALSPQYNPYLNLSRSEENTSELQSLMRNSYDVFCMKKKKNKKKKRSQNKKEYKIARKSQRI